MNYLKFHFILITWRKSFVRNIMKIAAPSLITHNLPLMRSAHAWLRMSSGAMWLAHYVNSFIVGNRSPDDEEFGSGRVGSVGDDGLLEVVQRRAFLQP